MKYKNILNCELFGQFGKNIETGKPTMDNLPIRRGLLLLRPGEIGLLCALNDYDFNRLCYSLNSIGNVLEAIEDLNRLQEITGISKFSLTFVLFYVYISRSSVQNLLVTLKNKKALQLCSTYIYIYIFNK